MMTAYPSLAYTEEQKEQILQQLDRLLANVHFANSRRFPSFLRFVTREELEGRGDQLKERTLGVVVFGREAGYDTTSNPIVRVTAAEIRKRIAQYYQEPGHTPELRISLPPGSYVPHFQWAKEEGDAEVPLPALSASVAATAPREALPGPLSSAPARRPKRQAVVVLLAIGLAAVSYLTWRSARPAAIDTFWSSVLSSGETVSVVFPQSHLSGITLRDAQDPAQQRTLTEGISAVIVDDLRPLVSLAGLLELRHQHYTLMGEDSASLTDLRGGPAVFLGAFDNAWTLRATRGLRFRFGNDVDMKHFWIEDAETHTRWSIDRTQQEATNNYRDYAIVARFQNASTGKPAVVVAGIARGGTVAAGEFVTQPGNMEALKAQAPRNWDGKNMELVLSTEIIDGRSAPPKIEAVYFW